MTAPEKPSQGGALLIGVAKLWFVAAGFATQIALPHLFGSAAAFGNYKVAMNGISILNNVIVAGTIQTVSKLVSEDEVRRGGTVRRALAFQLALGASLAALVATLAPSIADFARDPTLAPPLQIGALVVLAYSIYATLVGALNGEQRFATQARFDIVFTTLRAGGLVAGAALGLGAIGAFAGFAAAAWAITLGALVVVGMGARGEGVSYKRMLAFLAPIWLYQGLLNAALLLDAWLVKRGLADLAIASGASDLRAAELASEHSGYYGAAQSFAFVPYQLVLAITLVVFPMVSRATASGDEVLARDTVRGAFRLTFLFLLAMAAPMVGAPDAVLRIPFAPDYVAGAGALRVLVIGVVAFTLFSLGATVISGAGRPGVAALCAASAVITLCIANPLTFRFVALGPRTLEAAAAATALGMIVACAASAIAVHQRFRTFIPGASVLRGLFAAAIGATTAALLPHGSKLMSLVALVAAVIVYVVALVLTGELSADERARIGARLRKKRA